MAKQVQIDLIPNDSSPSKHIKISLWRIWLWVFMLFFTLGAGFWMILHPEIITHFLNKDTKLIQQQQRNLKANIRTMEQQVDSVSRKINKLNESQTKIHGFIDKDPVQSPRLNQVHLSWTGLSTQEIHQVVDSLHQSLIPLLDSLNSNPNLHQSLPLGHPLGRPSRVSAKYGMRMDPFTGRKLPHFGVDFPCSQGDTIYAPGNGLVSTIGKDRGFGIILSMKHRHGVETTYAHLNRTLVNRQSRVKRGQAIALCGSSGKSTGPHLHYEMSVNDHNFDPMRVIELHQ